MIRFCLVLLLFLSILNTQISFGSETLNFVPKDPKLISGIEYKKMNNFSQKRKNHKDKKEHLKFKQILSAEEYEIYLIAENILRSNNLQYKNWRVGFFVDKEVLNAISLNNSLVMINSSLYDCLHQNDSALAFVISHELAHFILSHQRIAFENNYKIRKIQNEIAKIEQAQKEQIQLNNLSKILNAEPTDELKLSGNRKMSTNLKNLINNIYLTQRQLELDADSLAVSLIIRAGYNLEEALEVFDYYDEDYNFYENKNNYPMIYERIDNILNEYNILDAQELAFEGKNNYLTSEVLTVQKSMDRETLVINRPVTYKTYSYNLVDKNEKLLKKAYSYYKIQDIKNAVKYFEKAFESNPNDFIAPLYLSYCYEYYYNIDGSKNYLKLAKRYIRKAKAIKTKEKNFAIIEQYNALYQKH